MTLVSVVVPAYNAASTLAETIDSISAQDWSDLEIVIVNDGSSDDTVAVAGRLAERDSRIRLVSQANAGASAARNHGIRVTCGSYVAPCDSDDLWHPQKISRMVRRIEELGPETGYVYSLSRTVDAEGRITGQKGIPGFEGATYLRSLVINFVGNGSAILVRREALDDTGGYSPALKNCDDWHMQTLMSRRWRVGCVPQFLTGYRITSQGKSMNHLRMKATALVVLRALTGAYPETPARVRACVESMLRARLAVVDFRNFMLVATMRDLARSVRLSPRTAFEILAQSEIPRLAGKAWRLALTRCGVRDAPRPGPLFRETDPEMSVGDAERIVLPWLVDALTREEEGFFSVPSSRPSGE